MSKILIVCSGNHERISTFITEQVDSLSKLGYEFEYFYIKGKGLTGYLGNISELKKKIKTNNYSFIHAHFGLSGLLANLQRKLPVITTYHGSDVHFLKFRLLSIICSRLSVYNILTNKRQIKQLYLQYKKDNFSVIKCGIDTNVFRPMVADVLRKKYGYTSTEILVLFSSSFKRKVKNADLAKSAVSLIDRARLIELNGYSREQVAELINIANVVLVTSKYETGPLIVKEALSCNTPVVSTDVGDVSEVLRNLENCYIVSNDSEKIAETIKSVIKNSKHEKKYRKQIQKFDLKIVANKISGVYQRILGSI